MFVRFLHFMNEKLDAIRSFDNVETTFELKEYVYYEVSNL